MTINAAAGHRSAASAQRGRTIVLGMDSIDLLLLKRWTVEGHLPFFQELLDECTLVRLTALSRVLQGSIWPSILSGLSPGQHGHFSFTQLRTGTYNLDAESAASIEGERFYERLGAHGVRSAVVDIPTDLPCATFNGLQVVDWGTEFKYWGFATQPPELKGEIESRFGSHVLADYGSTGASLATHRKLRDDLLAAVSLKAAFTRELLERPDLDMILVVFGEPHKGGHFFWKHMDATHQDHVPIEPELRDALFAQYQLIDREFADLVSRLTPQDNLILFADHGMQANYRGEHFVETILQRLELSKTESQGRLAGSGQLPATRLQAVGRGLRRTAHRIVRRIAPADLTQKLRDQFGAAALVDWSKTRAFATPTDRNTYLRINLRGREPKGSVSPGAEYEALLTYIETEFRALINAETGKPAVEEVFRVQELYPGPRAVDLPDLAILWSSDSPLNVLESAKVGRLEKRMAEQRSGNHRPEGFLLGRGPAFKPGHGEIRGDILQIPATLLALHGVPIPSSYAMGPLVDVLV